MNREDKTKQELTSEVLSLRLELAAVQSELKRAKQLLGGGMPGEDGDGSPRRDRGTSRDIAGREEMQLNLNCTEALLLSAVEHIPAGIVIADYPDVTVRVANSAARRIVGADCEPQSGTTREVLCSRTFHPDGTPFKLEDLPLFQAILHGKTSNDSEAIIRRPDGEDRWILAHCAPVHNANGTIVAGVMVFSDITDRKIAETCLHESEERYRAIFENAEDCVFIKSPDSVYSHVNPAMEKILQRPACQIVGKRDEEIFNQREGTRTDCVDRAVLSGETVREVQVKFVKDAPRTFHVIKAPLRDRNAKIVGILGMARDVTDQKKVEEALREHEQMLQNILSASPVAISYVEEGSLIWTNHTMAKMFGYEREHEYLGKRAEDFYADQEEYRRVLKIFKENTSQGLPVETEAKFKRKDGSVFDGQLKIRVMDPQRYRSPTISAIADISEKKRADEALHESRSQYRNLYEESQRIAELYRTLLDASPDPIVVCDVEGRPTYVNPAFTRVFDWTLRELSGRRLDLVPHEEWAERQSRGDRYFHNYESRCFTKSGRAVEVSVSGSVYHDRDGNAAGSVIQLRDVTERRRLEEQLRQAVKMEAIGRLAGGIAHDFNNLLTAVIGYSDMLLQDLPTDSPYRKRVFQVSSAAKRAASLTKQLLAFSRKQVLAVEVLDLNAVISGLEEILGRLIGEDIQLITLLEPSLGMVEADPGQVEQILVNLAVNARDAMPRGGTLTIETANVTLDEEYTRTRAEVSPGRYVMISVADTGCGMEEEIKTRIFDPFFTTKPKGEGTGLGLSTAYGIVKQHHGHIVAYSELHRGTVFKVYLPWTRESVERACEPQTPHESHQGGETVLLVEDDDTVRGLAREVLELFGYAVISAADPEQALAASKDHQGPIHLLVTDVVLPQMDGTALFKELAPLRPEMGVLYVSGYTESFISRHGVLQPGVHFLQKPFTVGALSRKVRQVLDAYNK